MEKYQYSLNLQQLEIKNFRGFEDLKINFDERLTVFIGINGSGKSSILDLIAENFRQLVHQWFQLGKENYFLNAQKDIKYGSDGISTNELYYSVDYPYYNENRELANVHEDDQSELKLDTKLPPNFVTIGRDIGEGQRESILDEMKSVFETLKRTDLDKIHLPILAYYQAGSLSQKNALKDDFDTHILSIYDDLLENKSLSFQNLKKWFEWRQKLDLQRQQRGKSNEGFRKITEAIYQDILQMLNDDGENAFTEIYIDWEKDQYGEFVLVKNGDSLKENQLSSGEKLLFTLVADISAKLALANPASENPSKEGAGVVLIDEIDLHLHPKWQRKVVTKLREIFPNVQFVITTHSPALLSNSDRKHVRILKNGEIQASPFVKGRDINSILEDVFEVEERPQEYKTKIAKFYEALESNVDLAKSLLSDLKKDYGSADIEIVRAESYLEIY
jgi:predicted ATP-binding protein involved in virulence